MKKEDKELLLKDLCARLPYGVKLNHESFKDVITLHAIDATQYAVDISIDSNTSFWNNIEQVRPYLFPLSSMNKDQKREYHQSTSKDIGMLQDVILERINGKDNTNKYAIAYNGIDWLNAHHFDYRGLIEKGLAIDATGLNIY